MALAGSMASVLWTCSPEMQDGAAASALAALRLASAYRKREPSEPARLFGAKIKCDKISLLPVAFGRVCLSVRRAAPSEEDAHHKRPAASHLRPEKLQVSITSHNAPAPGNQLRQPTRTPLASQQSGRQCRRLEAAPALTRYSSQSESSL